MVFIIWITPEIQHLTNSIAVKLWTHHWENKHTIDWIFLMWHSGEVVKLRLESQNFDSRVHALPDSLLKTIITETAPFYKYVCCKLYNVFYLPINAETEKAHIHILNRKIEMAGGKNSYQWNVIL